MAFGLSPKYIQDLRLESLTKEQFLVLAIEAAKNLDWSIGFESETGFIAYTPFSMSSWSEEITVKIEDGYATIKSECSGNQIYDWGKNKRNVEAIISDINIFKVSATPEELARLYGEFQQTIILKEERQGQTPPATKGKLANIFSIFWPSEGYFITPIIINLNIAIYLLMIISGVDFMSPDTKALLHWGANFRPLTLNGEWWRLITNVFLHIGLLHLLLNMYALLYIGILLEPYLGKLRFTAAYLLTGIAASTVSLYWHEMTVSAGASGAIFGMYGVFLAMLTTNFIDKAARKTLLTSIGIFVVYNLMNGMKNGIDNAAHIGGLVSGFIIGYLYYPSLKAPDRMDLKLGMIGALSIGILFICSIFYRIIPNVTAQYDAKMKTFSAMENMALEVYRMPKTTTRDSLLLEIKDRGFYYWNQNIELLNGLEKLDLPDVLHDRNRKLINYCNLRLKSYHLMYKMVDESNAKYKDSIELYNKNIQAVIDSLKGK
ncbi:MAG: gluP [Mucilaginibacter sp.]|jgi:rhomboid protease GluP|nr:gluP [Mucilaginibacter sp.]